jgi:hypothetical protein
VKKTAKYKDVTVQTTTAYRGRGVIAPFILVHGTG